MDQKVKGGGAINHSTVARWFKNFCSGFKDRNDQARSTKPKPVYYEVVLRAIEAELVINTQRVSGEVWFVSFMTSTNAYEVDE